MIMALKAVEGLTKATILVMFHIWYVWGCWLSRYVTINTADNDTPLSYHFNGKKAYYAGKEEDNYNNCFLSMKDLTTTGV
jgi:hypothetical protein